MTADAAGAGVGPAHESPEHEIVVVPDGFLVRPMTVWDIPEVLQLEAELFPQDAWPARFYQEELAQAGPHGTPDAHGRPTTRDYRVVVRDESSAGDGHEPGEIVGYGGIMAVGDIVDVQTIGTAPGAQGRGLGALQLRWMLREAALRGAEALMLEVRASNAPAQRLYTRHGFERVHVRRGYYPGGEDAWIMRRSLAPQRSAPEDGAQN